MNSSTSPNGGWFKNVSIHLLLAANLVAVTYYAARLEGRIDLNQSAIERNQDDVKATREVLLRLAEITGRVTTVEDKLKELNTIVEHIRTRSRASIAP